MNIFTKIVSIIIFLLIPIIVLFMFSNRVSVNVVQEHAKRASLDKLFLLENQIENNVSQLAMFPILISSDPTIRNFVNRPPKTEFDYVMAESRVIEKFSLQSVSSIWKNDLNLFVPDRKLAISSNIFVNYDEDYLKKHLFRDWRYEQAAGGFIRQFVNPATADKLEHVSAIYQVRFDAANLKDMLDRFEEEGTGNPLLFHTDYPAILAPKYEYLHLDLLTEELKDKLTGGSGDFVVLLHKEEYLVQYVELNSLGWWLVDYFPLRNTTVSINFSRNLFFVSTLLLLVMSVIVAFFLYKDVKIPLYKLKSKLGKFKSGYYNARIQYAKKNEFGFVFESFNDMAVHIQNLIENIYLEKIRVREANLKQLQSQINPHFLYNSLFYIVNMNELENYESASRMATNLARYYQYSTRLENQWVTVREEMDMVRNYLSIVTLRIRRFRFEIDVPEEMLELSIPRLIFQPIVENAIVHGLDRKVGDGWIRISGTKAKEGGQHRIVIEDNGVGMTLQKVQKLQQEINMPLDENMGCGTWNVHQRLIHQYGENSGLTFMGGNNNGVKVIIHWNDNVTLGG